MDADFQWGPRTRVHKEKSSLYIINLASEGGRGTFPFSAPVGDGDLIKMGEVAATEEKSKRKNM